MSCAAMSQSTTAAVARQISCPGVSGARYSLPSRWEQRPLKRTKTEMRNMIAAIKKTAAERPGAHPDDSTELAEVLGEPQELIRQLQSVLDGRCKPRELLPEAFARGQRTGAVKRARLNLVFGECFERFSQG